MGKQEFTYSAKRCFENAERILDDAIWLSDANKISSAYALSIIAQEEYAKSFLFTLLENDVIKWNSFINRSIKDHTCKQLIGIIIDHLNPACEDFGEFISGSKRDDSIRRAFDAIDILRHEKIGRWKSNNWIWDEEPVYDVDVKKVFNGSIDKKKQDALFIRVDKNGKVVFEPTEITVQDSEEMIDRARRFSVVVKCILQSDKGSLLDYDKIKEVITLLFENV